MKVDNDNAEPVTDSQLALGYSNQCIQRRLNNDSGAGANAGSRVDMTFVATNPLSELVWSPRKGLSLKCADCSLAEKRSSLLCGAGPSKMVLSPPKSITAEMTNINKAMDEGNMITSQATFQVKGDFGETATLARPPRSNAGTMPVCGSSHGLNAGTGGNLEEMNTAVEASSLDIDEKKDPKDDKRKGICVPLNIPMAAIPGTKGNKFSSFPGLEHGTIADSLSFRMDDPKPDMVQVESMFRDVDNVISSDSTSGRGDVGSVGSDNQTQGMEVVLASEVHAMETPLLDSASPGGRDEKLALVMKEESKTILKTPGSTSAPIEILESMAENDLKALNSENAFGAVSKTVGRESAHEVKNSSWQDEDTLPGHKNVPVEHSPTKTRVRMYQRKGKEKALSDGGVNGKNSKEGEDSHESVESCNSAGLFSTGKKRQCFEQQLMIGSKRIKEQIPESPGSTSFRQDSSFLNWISNMMKGFSKSDQDETPSLALTLAHPSHGNESRDRKLFARHKNQDSGYRNMGFQTIFQSLYCPNTKVQETRTQNADYRTHEGSNELELAKNVCDINVTPIACRRVNDNFCKQFLLLNEKHNQSISGNGTGTSPQPKIQSPNSAASQENKANSGENRISCNLASGMEKGEVSLPNNSLGKRKTYNAGNNDSDPPSEGKPTNNFGRRSDSRGSLWITRFSPKTSGPMLNLDHGTYSMGGDLECSAECTRLIPYSQNRLDFSKERKSLEAKECCTEDPLNVVGRELQNCAADTGTSFGLKKIKGHNDQKLIHKLNPLFKTPEAMASIFARRLDALKSIPSDVTDNITGTTTTCFFCGIRGHKLQDCLEIMETEFEDLLRNFNSHDGAEESNCFCIRCFQLNHWAVACPNVSSRRRCQSECGASMVNACSSSKIQLNEGNERNPKLLENKESQSQATGTHTVCDEKIPRMDTDLKLNQKLSGILTSEKMASNLNLVKNHIASNSGENESEQDQIIPLRNFTNWQIPNVPKGIFDAIRRLRLSRSDILKWMNSHISLSRLGGFFLRLRLGKWEEGLGGTGYYVACITGAQKEKLSQSSKYPIPVNIGGIKCLVESQYVSNQDFLEDELMAWWCATLKCGGKIPSEKDLTVKFQERKNLHF